jgi:enterochelin esterase-like enzyme
MIPSVIAYARFLLDEILPAVGKEVQPQRRNPDEPRHLRQSAAAASAPSPSPGRSPTAFRKVMSHIGSFTNIRGGHVYPALIRKTDREAAAQSSFRTVRTISTTSFGNWPLANQQIAAALKFAGYDYQFVLGEGTHNGKHGAAMLPDTLRWLWKK